MYPRSQEAARPNTLSSRYGKEAFPMHTDFVLRPRPAKYILLVCPIPRDARTIIYESFVLWDEFYEKAARSLFLVQGGKSSFVSRLVEREGAQKLIRYNPAIMRPLNHEAIDMENHLHNDIGQRIFVDWSCSGAAIIDNWRCLHGREALANGSDNGLWRIAMGER